MIVSSGNQAQRAIALGAFAKLPVLSRGSLLSSNVNVSPHVDGRASRLTAGLFKALPQPGNAT